jgi:protein-S-isoprenylcysteine O-methyltransferase Ste14
MKKNYKDYWFVSIQFILFFCFIFDFDWSLKLSLAIQKIGFVIAVFGGIIMTLALLQLNKNISPFPTPKDSASLLRNGLYKFMRHPIYTGIILLFSGYSVYQNSFYKLLVSVVLVILFYLKSNYEEQRLQEKFPDYKRYKSKTGRFFPWI